MLHFEGDRACPLPPPAVWIQMGDARFLTHCMPDVVAVKRNEPLDAVFTVKPGFAFVRGSLETHLHISASVPERSVSYDVLSKGIGSHAKVAAAIELAPSEQGTQVHWIVDIVELGGLLKAVPKGLIQAAAQKVIADVWSAIDQQLGATHAAQ